MRLLRVLGFAAALLTGCQGTECAGDGDCVADSCCHADGAMPRRFAGSCSGQVCTDEYRECTTDNPAITPVCRNGTCELSKPPWCAVMEVLP